MASGGANAAAAVAELPVDPLVAIIGLGGVGSHCAHALVRAGVRRLRLVDFDRVSLSSLNRHAVATRCDVGISKVAVCAKHFNAIRPGIDVDARDEMFTAERSAALLDYGPRSMGERGDRPEVVIDCIDDVPTKADLLAACISRGIRTLSGLGSGAKGDPTQLCLAKGLRDIENDPLATKLRKVAATRKVDFSTASFMYSSQKPQRSLLPLSEEQKAEPQEFGNVANFRLRVIPVLGTQPALEGVGLAVQALSDLGLAPAFNARPAPQPPRATLERYLELLRKREGIPLDVTLAEARFLVHEVWKGRSALNTNLAVAGASGHKFTFARWDPTERAVMGNLILVTVAEAEAHSGPDQVELKVRRRVEASLQWATRCMAFPPCEMSAPSDAPTPSQLGQSLLYARSVDVPDGLPEQSQKKLLEHTQSEEDALLAEQLSRSAAFLGLEGQARVRNGFIVVVGVGAVGSAATALLARTGVRHLRLIDAARLRPSACHAVARSDDTGQPLAEICKRHLQRVLPCCGMEAFVEDFKALDAERLLWHHGIGRWPDVILDCARGTATKAGVLAAALERRIPAVSAVAPEGLTDPTRIAVAPLSEVHASPLAVALRLCLAQSGRNLSSDDAISVVHSQELGQWGSSTSSCSQGGLLKLSVGLAAAAIALHQVAGEPVPAVPPPGTVGSWKKLLHSFTRQNRNGAAFALDVHAVGCVTESVWQGRSALTRAPSMRPTDVAAGLALTCWNRALPPMLWNLVLLTGEEAAEHESATKETGSLPRSLLEVLEGRCNLQPHNEAKLLQQLRVHQTLLQLQEHLAGHKGTMADALQTMRCSEVGKPHTPLPVQQRSANFVDVLKLGGLALVAVAWRYLQPHNGSVATGLVSVGTILGATLGGGVARRMARSLYSNQGACHPQDVREGLMGLVGSTKLIELRSLSNATGCRIVAKAEFLSPGGCQKDRAAKRIIEEAERNGLLKPGGTIVEGTSGSTGISLSLAAAAKGYRVCIVMPDDQAIEKVELLRRFGAEVELVRPASITSPEHYVNVARCRAEELNRQSGGLGAHFSDQFENLANFRAHYDGTGPELWDQCAGKLDAFVMSAGTGGTIAGVGRFLKERRPAVRVVLADVSGSSLYNKVAHGVLYASEQAERSVRRHRTDTIAEGIGLDRLTSNFAEGLPEHNGGLPCVDDAVQVSDQEALEMAHHLLRHEGIFVGSSAAVNCAGAVKVARAMGPGHTIATLLCDSGQRHLTKFYNPEVWEAFKLTQPVPREAADVSFIQ